MENNENNKKDHGEARLKKGNIKKIWFPIFGIVILLFSFLISAGCIDAEIRTTSANSWIKNAKQESNYNVVKSVLPNKATSRDFFGKNISVDKWGFDSKTWKPVTIKDTSSFINEKLYDRNSTDNSFKWKKVVSVHKMIGSYKLKTLLMAKAETTFKKFRFKPTDKYKSNLWKQDFPFGYKPDGQIYTAEYWPYANFVNSAIAEKPFNIIKQVKPLLAKQDSNLNDWTVKEPFKSNPINHFDGQVTVTINNAKLKIEQKMIADFSTSYPIPAPINRGHEYNINAWKVFE